MNTQEMVDGFSEGFKAVRGWLPRPMRKKCETVLEELRAARRLWGEMTPKESSANLEYIATVARFARRSLVFVAVIELLERAEDIT